MSENQNDRASIAAEVWDDAEQSPTSTAIADELPVIEEAKPEEVKIDPWAGVPAALREEVEGLRTKVGSLDEISLRLKQTESRIGGLTNDLHAAKEAAKTKAPSEEDTERALAIQAELDDLKELLPGLDHKFAAERADMLKQMPNIEEIRKEFRDASNAESEKLEVKFGTAIVAFKHPNFTETVKTPEFLQWMSEHKVEDSFDPTVMIGIMDKFTEYKSKQKSSKEIADERTQRLDLAQNPIGHKLPPVKSEADMSLSEIRASEAKKVWAQT